VPDYTQAVLDILTTEMQTMLSALKKDTPENFRRKANNFLLSQFDPDVLFYTVFTSSFESKSGNALENCAKAIARLRYGPNSVPAVIQGLGATKGDIDAVKAKHNQSNKQYIVTRKSLKAVDDKVRAVISNHRSESSTNFEASHILDLAGFVKKLKDAENPVSQYIEKGLGQEALKVLNEEKPGNAKLNEAIVDLLNGVLTKQLYSKDRFEEAAFSKEITEELDDRKKGKRLNRLLLEHAYPDELQSRRAGITQTIMRKEIVSFDYPKDNPTTKPVDLFIVTDKDEALCMELKLGGDLDNSNAPAQLAKFLALCAIADAPQIEGYFATIYNKDGEGKRFTGTVRSYLAADMILAGSEFWAKILPDEISFEQFIGLYHQSLEVVGMNAAIRELVDMLAPVSDNKKKEIVGELTN
jgi:hypothetical protein